MTVPSDAPVIPPSTASRWRRGEDALFSAMMTQPEFYQHATLVVAKVLQRLRGLASSSAALLAAADSGIVDQVLADERLSGVGLDLDLVLRASLSIRLREVVTSEAARARLRLLADARAAGRPWVVLDESGDTHGDLFRPYRRLEAEVATGRGLVVRAAPDEAFRRSVHSVEHVQLDLDGGGVFSPDSGEGEPSTHRDAHAREVYAAAERERPSRS